MSDGENPQGEHKLRQMYTGVVIDDVDPEKLARVRVRIPGLIDDTGWCFPMGSPGGGTFRRGLKMVPRVNSEVCILFRMGNPDDPYYLPGNWGNTEAGIETPGGGREPRLDDEINGEGDIIGPEDAKMVHVLETESFILSIDERTDLEDETKGKGSFSIRSKLSGNTIEYDGLSNSLIVRAEILQLQATGLIDIRGDNVQINGRVVLSTSDPI